MGTDENGKRHMRQQTDHLRSIDGLRGFACMAVVLHHCGFAVPFLGTSLSDSPHPLFFGCLGVEIFFAISGFCLSYPAFANPARETNWATYAKNRVRRIVPPAWAAMILFICLGLLIQFFGSEPLATARPVYIPVKLRYVLAMFLFGGGIYVNATYWTLALEARWYFALPPMLGLQKRFGSAVLVFAAVSTAIAYSIMIPHIGQYLEIAIGPLPFYLPLFALGIFAARIVARSADRSIPHFSLKFWRIGLIVSAVLICLFTRSLVVTPSRLIPSTFFAFFLLISALKDPIVGAFFAWRPLVWIGGFSYSLYLVHATLINIAIPLVHQFRLDLLEQFFALVVLLPVAILPIAYGFYLLFEKPFLRKRRDPVPVPAGGLIAASTLVR